MALDTNTINQARLAARLSFPDVGGTPFRENIYQGIDLANLQYGWTVNPRDTIRLYRLPSQPPGLTGIVTPLRAVWCITIQAEPRSTRPDPALAKQLKALRWMRVTNHSWVYYTPVPAPWNV